MKQTSVDTALNTLIRGGIILTLFLPILVYDQLLFPFIFTKSIAFRVITEVLVAAFLLQLFRHPRTTISLHRISVSIGVFVVALIASGMFGINEYQSFWSTIERSEGIITWLHLLAFLIVLTSTFKTRADWITLFKAAIMASWLQAIYAVSQYLGLPFTLNTGGERIGGSIGNASFLAGYLIFIIFIGYYLLQNALSNRERLYYATSIVVNLFLLWQTQTRGALLGIVAGFGLILFLQLVKKNKDKLAYSGFIAILIVIFCGGVLIVNRDSDWLTQSATLERITSISPTDITTQNRLIVWGSGINAFFARPIFGWGYENFDVAFTKYFDPTITRDIGSNPWYDRAHNVFVEIAATTGIVGLIAYLALIAAVLVSLLQLKKNELTRPEAVTFLGLGVAYVIHNFFVFDTISSYLMLILILGYIISRDQKNRGEYTFPEKYQLLLPIFALLIIPILYFSVVRPVLASHYTIEAITTNKENPIAMTNSFKRALSFSSVHNRELRFILIQHTRDIRARHGITEKTIPLITLAIDESERTISTTPESVRLHLLLAELYMRTTELSHDYLLRAEQLARTSIELAPRRYQTYSLMGRIQMSLGNYDNGIMYFTEAVALNNDFREAWWNLGIAYTLTGNRELAEASFQRSYAGGYNIYSEEAINLRLQALSDAGDYEGALQFLDDLKKRFPDNESVSSAYNTIDELFNAASSY